MKIYIDTESDIDNTVKGVFRKMVPCFSSDDTFVYKQLHRNVKIVYYSKLLSDIPSDLTGIELYLCLDTKDMWIGFIHVAFPLRSIGIGRQLLRAVEEVARSIDFVCIKVFPLQSSRSFWLKMKYQPHNCTARVLSKSVNNHCYFRN